MSDHPLPATLNVIAIWESLPHAKKRELGVLTIVNALALYAQGTGSAHVETPAERAAADLCEATGRRLDDLVDEILPGFRLSDAAGVAIDGATLACLGRTDAGTPRHPLYVPGAQPLEPYA